MESSRQTTPLMIFENLGVKATFRKLHKGHTLRTSCRKMESNRRV